MNDFGPLLFIVVGLGAAVLAYLQYRRKQARREALHAFAATNGLQYSRHDTGLLRLPFRFFNKGDDRGIENVVSGTLNSEPFTVFDYWYMIETRDSDGDRSRRYERFTCSVQPLDGMFVPRIAIGPENFLSRVKDKVGFRDIEFESDEFNRTFEVDARNREFAYRFCDARMMQWLLMTRQAIGDFEIEVLGQHALLVTDTLDPDSWLRWHVIARDFLRRIPRLVREYHPDDA